MGQIDIMERKMVQVEGRESTLVKMKEKSKRAFGRLTEMGKGMREGLKTKEQRSSDEWHGIGLKIEEIEGGKCS